MQSLPTDADEWESLQDTRFWLSRPGTLDDIVRARRELREGTTASEERIRAEFGIPAKDQP